MTDPSSTEVVQEDLSPGEDCADEQEASFEDVHTTLILDNTHDLTQVEYDLPTPERCAAHTMWQALISIYIKLKSCPSVCPSIRHDDNSPESVYIDLSTV